jgi:hypothetical protein
MGTDCACSLFFCAAKRSDAFPPNIPAKGCCTDRAIFTPLRSKTDKLCSYSSPAAAAPRLTSNMLPHASLLCCRRKPTVETFVDDTAKLRPQASVLALRAEAQASC